MEIQGMTWQHSCPERVTFLLESVSGVESVHTSFKQQQAVIRAKGELCTSAERRDKLEYVLLQNQYKGQVLAVKDQSYGKP